MKDFLAAKVIHTEGIGFPYVKKCKITKLPIFHVFMQQEQLRNEIIKITDE